MFHTIAGGQSLILILVYIHITYLISKAWMLGSICSKLKDTLAEQAPLHLSQNLGGQKSSFRSQIACEIP